MSDLLTPADVERLARSLGITMAEVCRRAGVATSIFTRWKSGQTRPGYRNYQRIYDVVHARHPANDATPPPPQPGKPRKSAAPKPAATAKPGKPGTAAMPKPRKRPATTQAAEAPAPQANPLPRSEAA